MVSILDKLGSMPKDKLLHSFYGTLVYAVIALVDVTLAFGVTVLVAISKEVYDFRVKGEFSLMDIIATVGLALVLWVGSII